MKLLAIDVGNARTHFGLFEGMRLRRAWATGTGRPFARPRADAIAYASVVPAVAARLHRWGALRFGRDFPAAIRTRTRGAGDDRLANAAAAFARVRGACVVVSFGTAVTVDAVSADGEFLGGTIAPGAGLAADALHHRCAQLPFVEPRRPSRAVGRDTREAIASGIWHAAAGLVREISRAHRGPVIATGADAPLFASIADVVAPHLALEGVALSYLRWIGRA